VTPSFDPLKAAPPGTAADAALPDTAIIAVAALSTVLGLLLAANFVSYVRRRMQTNRLTHGRIAGGRGEVTPRVVVTHKRDEWAT
jgi:hypothetical protein